MRGCGEGPRTQTVLENTSIRPFGTEGCSGAACKASLVFSALVYVVSGFVVCPILGHCVDLGVHVEFAASRPGQISLDSVLGFSNPTGQPGTDFWETSVGLMMSNLAPGNKVRGEKGNCLGSSAEQEL